MLPRRWKRYVGIVALTVLVVRPDLAGQAAGWIWEERAKRATALVTDTFLPPPPPAPALTPPSEDPAFG